jgi:hypothetical protein
MPFNYSDFTAREPSYRVLYKALDGAESDGCHLEIYMPEPGARDMLPVAM